MSSTATHTTATALAPTQHSAAITAQSDTAQDPELHRTSVIRRTLSMIVRWISLNIKWPRFRKKTATVQTSNAPLQFVECVDSCSASPMTTDGSATQTQATTNDSHALRVSPNNSEDTENNYSYESTDASLIVQRSCDDNLSEYSTRTASIGSSTRTLNSRMGCGNRAQNNPFAAYGGDRYGGGASGYYQEGSVLIVVGNRVEYYNPGVVRSL